MVRLQIDGKDHEFDLSKQSDQLARASREQREHVEISPGGYGLHWPDVDEQLAIGGPLGVTHPPPIAESEA